MIWTPDNVQRIILDTAGRILQQPHAGLPTTVLPDLDLYLDLGLDSLKRMELAAHLNEFFGIFQTSANNYLLASTNLRHWTSCILRARSERDAHLTFRTSGTGGQYRAIPHTLSSLLAEARFLANLLPPSRQVISTVPANHIYGFLYTILLPILWHCPLRLLADLSVNDLDEETLLVGTPFTWELLYQSLPAGTKIACRGVSSTAPMPPGLFSQLATSGVDLTEIYGSSETGGLAYRRQPGAAFRLFPYWQISSGQPARVTHCDTGASFPVPDRLEQLSSAEIQILGRFDDSVSIAGVNVYPAYVKEVIEACPLVAECDVYAKATDGISQLYGAIRLRTHNDLNREGCLRWLREHLSAPETPKHLYIY